MFCYQCEQTSKGEGCTKIGVCGKTAEVAALQDLLIFGLKGLSLVAVEARKQKLDLADVNRFTLQATFSTLTNVDFDPARIVELIGRCAALREDLKKKVKQAGGRTDFGHEAAAFVPAATVEALVAQAEKTGGVKAPAVDADAQALRELLIYGLKGVAAYADHAWILGKKDESIYAFIHEAFASTLNPALGVNDYLGLVLKCGETNLKAMEILDAANTGTYGHPVPTKVPLGHKKGKAILVSGHDLKDLEEILKQSAGKGINVYTHGEMLPCHGYPRLKKYPHLAGNYGGAWQDQQKEFAAFPGAILMTTNCIQKPAGYADRIFTTGLVAFPGVRHIDEKKDFTPVIEAALAAPGFEADGDDKQILVGFGHNAVLNAAGKVVELVKAGKIRHFFLVGGCDGAKSGRNYYTDFAAQAPKDTVILTLACGKFRFNKLDFGDIDGLPRLLDVGQCNDAASALKIAAALAEAFGTDVNGLPLSLVLSWYEQKAVCILLSLLSLGIRNIRLGPSLPAFVKPPVLEFLQKTFNIQPITTPEADLKAILG